MKRHYKGEVVIALDSWGENEEEAIENYFWNLAKSKNEKAEVLDADLECVEEDDSDDRDYYEGIEYANRWENEK